MKLSEAIRLGAMLRPQARYAFRDSEGGSCALGAALDALGVVHNHGWIADADKERMREMWGELVLQDYACPACDETASRMEFTIIHLNNDHRWTREQIADWVESIERARESREALQALSLVGVGIE